MAPLGRVQLGGLSFCLLLALTAASCGHGSSGASPTPAVCPTPTTSYYVDPTGNDASSGTSPSSAWATLSKINSTNFNPCTAVYFKAGGVWHGQVFAQSGTTSGGPIIYGAYGSGAAPEIRGSFPLTGTAAWSLSSANVWKSAQASLDAANGNVPLDVQLFYLDTLGAVSPGFKKFALASLAAQGDFFLDPATGYVYLYSTSNPGTAYALIEVGLSKDVFPLQQGNNLVIQGLAIRFGAQNGINCRNCSNATFQDLQISYVGGGAWGGHPGQRLGNGIQLWANASNIVVQRNRIWQVYDTGVTNQSDNSVQAVVSGVTYQNNLIWNTPYAAVEIWNRGPGASVMSNVKYVNNTSFNPENGWSISQRPDIRAVHVYLGPATNPPSGVVVSNNIFYGGFAGMWIQASSSTQWNSATLNARSNDYYPGTTLPTVDVTAGTRWTATATANVYSMTFVDGKPTVQIGAGPSDCTSGVASLAALSSNGQCYYDGAVGSSTQGSFFLYESGAWPASIQATISRMAAVVVDQATYSTAAFATYQAALGLDQGSFVADPLFLSLTTPDFHLNSASPARTGGQLIGVGSDYDQVARPTSGSTSIGAYEYH